jgi:hypothetical protein
MEYVKFSTELFPFYKETQKILEGVDLATLHELGDIPLLTRETDQATEWHRLFYRAFRGSSLQTVYSRFARHLSERYQEPMLYQTVPTFRAQLPGNLAVGAFHRDRDYRHQPEEINVFLPITDAVDTSAIWVESAEGLKDYSPMNCLYGSAIIWDGANLDHGNKINQTGKTRVSLDFRIIPTRLFNYAESNRMSINNVLAMRVGAYWSSFEDPS